MIVRCPKCAARVDMKKAGDNYRGDCPTPRCGFTFRGEAPARTELMEMAAGRALTPHEENILTLVDAIFPEEA